MDRPCFSLVCRDDVLLQQRQLLQVKWFALPKRRRRERTIEVCVQRRKSPNFTWRKARDPSFWKAHNFKPVGLMSGVTVDPGQVTLKAPAVLAAIDQNGRVQGAVKFDICYDEGSSRFLIVEDLCSAPWNLQGPYFNPKQAVSGLGRVLLYGVMQTYTVWRGKFDDQLKVALQPSRDARAFYLQLGLRPGAAGYYTWEAEDVIKFMLSFANQYGIGIDSSGLI